MTTKSEKAGRRLRVIVSAGDAEPRIFEQSISGTDSDIERAVEAGAIWFGIACNETLRRARQRTEAREVDRAA